MPMYHFNIRDGGYFPDLDGSELANIEAAKERAVEMAGQLLKDNAKDFWRSEQWELEVMDPTGLLLFQITLLGSVSAAGLVAGRS
jgi:hypothetical protein